MGENLFTKKEIKLSTNPLLILIAILCAIPLGILIRKFAQFPPDSINYRIFYNVDILLTTMGSLYLNILKMVISPIIFTSIVTSLTGLVQSKYIGIFIRKFVLIYIAFFIVFSLTGVLSGIVFSVGKGINSDNLQRIGEIIQKEKEIEVFLTSSAEIEKGSDFFRFLLNFFSRNIFTSLVNDMRFQVVFSSILLGVAIASLDGKQRDYTVSFFTSVMHALQEITRWVLCLLPLGVFCLLSTQLAIMETGILFAMIKFIIVFFVTALILLALNTIIIWKRSKKKLGYVINSLMNPVIVALLSGSSYVALPVAVDTLSRKLGFFEKTSRLLLPLGITIGRFGSILYFAIVAVYAQHLYDQDFTMYRIGIIIISSILAGIASTGTTGPAAVGVLAFVLIPSGIPPEIIISIFIAIDVLADPIRNLLIVHTNIAASSLVIETTSTRGDRRLGLKGIKPLITLRASVVVLIVASIVLSGLTTFIVAYKGSKRSVYYIAENMMDEMSSAIADKTTGYMHGAESIIKELKYMLVNDNFNLDDEAVFLQLLREILVINEEIGSIYLGRPDGSFTMVKRMLDGSISYRVIKRTRETVSIDWIHDNDANTVYFSDEILPIDQGYDPRSRSWYNLAIDKDELVWQDVYVFSSDHIPGITCAIPAYKDNELIGVLGVDIGVAEFSFFLGDLDLSEAGEAVLLNNKDDLIAVSSDRSTNLDRFDRFIKSNQDNDKLELIPAAKSENPLIRDSYLTYQTTKNVQQLPVFHTNGKTYATFYKNFSPNDYFNWSIGIIIPELSLMAQVNRNNIIVITLGSFFMILSLLIGLKFSKSISKPLRLLSSEMEKVQAFSLNDIEEVPSVIQEVNEMNHSFANMVTGLRSFNKYVPSNLVSKLISLGKEAVIGGEKKVLTLFFSDIRNFTTICEKFDHVHLVKELEKYLSIMSKNIIHSSGTVDKYMGDGIMAFWGAPDEVKDHALQACYTALDCQTRLREISQDAPTGLFAQFYTRIGINTGEVIVGNMGSDERLDYTVIGDPANLASRLEGLNKVYGTHIIISESTYDYVKNQVEVRLLDRVAVKGKHQGVRIYELISRKGEIDKTGEQFIQESDYGASLYFNKEWEKAASVYTKLLQMKSGDVLSRTMLTRCQEYLENPPPDEWDGVYVLHTK